MDSVSIILCLSVAFQLVKKTGGGGDSGLRIVRKGTMEKDEGEDFRNGGQ